MVHTIFEARPGAAVLLLPDAPKFTILAASNDFVRISGREKSELVGNGHLLIVRETPAFFSHVNSQELEESYQQVIRKKEDHEIITTGPRSSGDKEGSSATSWKILNTPVLDDSGEVEYIIHTEEELRDQIHTKQQPEGLQSLKTAYQFFMTAPVIVGFLKGDDYIIELANESLLEVWGRTAEIIGTPLLTAIPELESQGFIKLLEEVRITGNPFYAYAYPITLIRNGRSEVLYFDFVYKPFYKGVDLQGKADGVISVGHNVTAQVLAKNKVEQAKKEAEAQKRLYETINGSTPDLIYVFDLNYRFTYANKALLNMWGRTWDEAIGKDLLQNGYEPWHAEMHIREIDEVVATRKTIRGSVSFPHATLGNRVYDYILVPVLGENGDVEAVAGTTRDITELKLAEQGIRESNERFRRMADDSPMFVFIIDADSPASVSYWNKEWLKYTGQSLEQALSTAWNGMIHADDIEEVRGHYYPAFGDRRSYFIPSVRIKRHDGEYRWHTVKGNPQYLA
ncbi:MAG TPA: PAS domain-containing protein, partial [Flavisolibacter sp.]|nr:PAS domain-containing protein [Flavisolibacter sp.]